MVAGAEMHGVFKHLLLIQVKGGGETAAQKCKKYNSYDKMKHKNVGFIQGTRLHQKYLWLNEN